MEMNIGNSAYRIKPYSYKELKFLYGVSYKTLKTWIQPFLTEIGEKRGRYFTIKQIKVIFEKLGMPDRTLTDG